MSQIAPDIPELAHLHEVIRPLVWTRAQMRAIRSPSTHLMGLACLATAVAAGVVAGLWILGRTGAMVGGLLGCGAAVYVYFRFLVEWQTRRLVPIVEKEVDWNREFGEAIRAQERIKSAVSRSQRGPMQQ